MFVVDGHEVDPQKNPLDYNLCDGHKINVYAKSDWHADAQRELTCMDSEQPVPRVTGEIIEEVLVDDS